MYEPTTWKTGDTITADRLNKLERGVRDNQGADATINGQNAVEIVAGDNITIDQETPGRLKISAVGGGSGIPLESVEITTPPDKTEYNAGESFESSGMVVTAHYAFGLSQVVTGYTVTPSGALTGDVTEVTITYSEGGAVKTAKQPVTVTRLTGVLSVEPSEISLDADTQTATAQLTYNGDGEITVESSAPDVVSAEISGAAVIVKSLADTSQTVTVILTAPETGTYTGATAELTVENYVTAHVYGAEWDGSATTKWSRTDDAELFEDPEPAANNGTGSSPFDNLMPWAGIEIVEDETAGTLVKIPKYWYKWTRSGATMKLQISDAPQEGFYTSPAHADRGDGQGERDFVYVGRYHCGSDYKSKTGTQPLGNMTRAEARAAIAALGAEYWQYDYAIFWTIAALYLVEFANWNSQLCIGYGCSPNGELFNTGLTDAMSYHTGTSAVNRTTYGCCQYRHIEGLWDNAFDWIDGVRLSDGVAYCISNPTEFSDESGGESVGTIAPLSSGYISSWTQCDIAGFEYAIFPNGVSGTGGTYICDKPNEFIVNGIMYAGGYYRADLSSGLFRISANMNATSQYPHYGFRLMKLPNSEV